MKNIIKFMTSIVLILTIVLNIVGCSNALPAGNLMDDVTGNPVAGKTADAAFKTSQMNFAAELLRLSAAEKGENALVSPLSVVVALAMTANGADGETKAQMEKVLGGELSLDDLNEYLHTYVENLPTSEKALFHIANSIWVNEPAVAVREDFLQKNADYYGAGVYSEPFGDGTADRINAWVDENTRGMIKNILDKVPADAIMYLVNALAFEAEWKDAYTKSDIRDGMFTSENGERASVEMMHSEENYYLKDKNTTGFIKPYAEGYSFVALLPDEDMTIDEYVASLTGEKLTKLLENKERTAVRAAMPKFEYEYSITMNDVLGAMGMTDAFDDAAADFSNLGTANGNISIGRVLHKTFIKVDGLGTKAGAATVVEMVAESAPLAPEDPKVVTLDRPFVYMIVDNETNLPLFIGTVTALGD